MSQIVVKFGGTSLGSSEKILEAAKIVQSHVEAGDLPCVVVSAMAGQTQALIELTQTLSYSPPAREYDVVLSSGEQVSAGLMSIALAKLGLKAKSLMGWQIPMRTDTHHTEAYFEDIDPQKLQEAFSQGTIPVVPGFQGVNSENNITTTGRGGSDVTAVAVAQALGNVTCYIYTDVPGVFTADPRIVPKARPLREIPGSTLLEMAQRGAKVIHPRAVALAAKQGVPLKILSTFQPTQGTTVCQEKNVEKATVKSIVLEDNIAHLNLAPSKKEEAFDLNPLVSLLSEQRFDWDNLHQNMTHQTLTFMMPAAQAKRFQGLLQNQDQAYDLEMQEGYSKVSLIGTALAQDMNICEQATKTLKAAGIPLKGLFSGALRLTLLVDQIYAELAMRLLHDCFKLDQSSGSVAALGGQQHA